MKKTNINTNRAEQTFEKERFFMFRFSADHFKEEEGEGGGDLLVAVVRVWV